MSIAIEAEFNFPNGIDLQQLLKLDRSANLDDLFSKALTAPLAQLLARPRKNLRGQLVALGFKIAKNRSTQPSEMPESVSEKAALILELLHTGSLVIDDIQDGSTHRRGLPSIHMLYGVPIALNAGNWLYFLPFRIIDEMSISDDQKRAISRACQETLLRAHYGQALDVGIPFDSVPQARVPEISAATMELKSGALASLAFKMGGIVGGASTALIDQLDIFGKRFGIALQMFDDIGSALSNKHPEKWAEDVKLRKLTFLISIAAETLPANEYGEYQKLSAKCTSESDAEKIRKFLIESGLIEKAKRHAVNYLGEAITAFSSAVVLTDKENQVLKELQLRLMSAYD